MKNILVFILFVIGLWSCNTTEPPVDDLQPGRRDYVWNVDTLKIPEGRTLPSRMWGTGKDNIWAVGASYLNAYCIWHYDGNKWENYVPDSYIDPIDIYGFSQNNIWMSSFDGFLWHFNGVVWSKNSEIKIENYHRAIIANICGRTPDNIYATGFAESIDYVSYKAVIMHYNGSKWEQVNIPTIVNSFDQIFYDEKAGNYLITGWVFDKPDEYIYSFNGNSLKTIYSTQDGLTLYSMANNIYAQVGEKLYKYKNGSIDIFKDFSKQNNAGGILGRSEKDFFTINWDGIGHYNGSDLITIYEKWNDDWFPGGGIVFEKDVFFIWDDSYNTFIVHGKLMN